MSRTTSAFASLVGSRSLKQSAATGAGAAVATGTAKAAGLLVMGKGMAAAGLGAVAGGPLGAAIAVGLMASLIYGSASARHRRG
ncbi:MAG: hypothetical protein HQL39_04735 [Alphaproteobacteria bacterium]|nr:hypothetical protein [Alphaproteobacteria bacterium]